MVGVMGVIGVCGVEALFGFNDWNGVGPGVGEEGVVVVVVISFFVGSWLAEGGVVVVIKCIEVVAVEVVSVGGLAGV